MKQALTRFLLDAIYVVIFFVVTSASAIALNWIVKLLKDAHVHAWIVGMVTGLEIVLVAIDVVGTIIAAGWLMWRFVVTLVKAKH